MFGRKKKACETSKMVIWLSDGDVKKLYTGEIVTVGTCKLFEKPVTVEIAKRKETIGW